MMAFLTMGAVISIEEIFKCAHMKTMARTSSAVLPLLLSPLRYAAPPTTLDLRGIKAFSNDYCIYCVHKLSNPAISL